MNRGLFEGGVDAVVGCYFLRRSWGGGGGHKGPGGDITVIVDGTVLFRKGKSRSRSTVPRMFRTTRPQTCTVVQPSDLASSEAQSMYTIYSWSKVESRIQERQREFLDRTKLVSGLTS